MKTTLKLCAGLAVAFALTAGEASAVTVLKQVGTERVVGGNAYSGQTDITSYLAGGAYKAVNARVTALGFSTATISHQLTSPSPPVLLDQTQRVVVPAHWEDTPCGSIWGCPDVWVPDVVATDQTFQTFQDDWTFDLVKDALWSMSARPSVRAWSIVNISKASMPSPAPTSMAASRVDTSITTAMFAM